MIKFLHTADLHLDSPFSGLPADKAARRRGEQRSLLIQIFELAEEHGADLLLFSGDVFDGEHVYYDTVDLFRNLCQKCGARIFIAPGNHDYYRAAGPYSSVGWPENVHIFKSQEISSVSLPELELSVYGAAFTGAVCSLPLLKGFKVSDNENKFSLMLMHGDTGASMSRYNPVEKADIARSGLDYLALGHVHSFSGFLKEGRSAYAYPGCPMGRGFDESGEKGLILGQISTDAAGETAVENLRFLPLGLRRYELLELELSGSGDYIEKIESSIRPELKNSICRLILSGYYSGEPLDTAELSERLGEHFFSLSIIDRTRLLRPVWDGEDEDTLRGLFLKYMKAAREASKTEKEGAEAELAASFGIAAIDNREAPLR